MCSPARLARILLTATFVLLAWRAPALACRYDRPAFQPGFDRANAVILGRVESEVPRVGTFDIKVATKRVLIGHRPKAPIQLAWHSYTGQGPCSPRGPYVTKGQDVVIYLQEGVVQGWMSPADAARKDARLAKSGLSPKPTRKLLSR